MTADAVPGTPSSSLDDGGWNALLGTIEAEWCTPFLGAGVAYGHLPLGRELAEWLAKKYSYPFRDCDNLPRVAQYVATMHGVARVRLDIRDRLVGALKDASGQLKGGVPENYRILAKLPIPLYITTNYDDFMERALEAEDRPATKVKCRWNDGLLRRLSSYPLEEPSVQRPVVFHLHGSLDTLESLLVTEDDYVTFLASLAIESKRDDFLWPFVREKLSSNLLFIGYSLEDWNFRVLLKYVFQQQNIVASQSDDSLSIQVPPGDIEEEQKKINAQLFLEKWLGVSKVRVHWRPAETFLEELGMKWEGRPR